MDLGVFYEVIVPLMEVEGTATICISTPLGKNNYYSMLTEVRDDKGKLVFNVRHIKGGTPPSWKPDEARSRVQAIYGGRNTLFRREIMGEVADDTENMAFSPAKLDKFFEKPTMQSPYVINDNVVYVAIDPNGGASASDGPGSDTGIVSFVVSQGRVVIVGLESAPTKTPAQPRQILYAHLDALRADPQFHNCEFVIIPEANLGDQAQLLSQVLLRRYRDVRVMCEKSHCYGIFTKPGDPERYVLRMRDKLSEDGLFFHSKLVCANPYAGAGIPPAARLAATMTEFKRQFYAFSATYVVPVHIHSQVRMLYSGKVGKEGKRDKHKKDDMLMALLFGYFNYLQYISPYNLVSERDSHSMLRIDPIGGTAVEGGTEEAAATARIDANEVLQRKKRRLNDALAGETAMRRRI